MTSPILVAGIVYGLCALISFAAALLIKAIYVVVRTGKSQPTA